MKKKVLVNLIWIFFLSVFLLNGEVINNSKTPLSKDAGRVVKLKKVLEISDGDGDFYMKGPNNIKIAPDGSIFLEDEKQFLKFTKEGKFIGNQQIVGEGPGEYRNISNYFFDKNSILLFIGRPGKILRTDFNGKLLKEMKTSQASMESRTIFQFDGNRYYYLKSSFGEIGKMKTGRFSMKYQLSWSELSGKSGQNDLFFDKKMYMVNITSKRGVMISIRAMFTSVYTAFGKNNLLASNSLKYNIKNIDLKKGKVINRINRKYRSVPFKKRERKEKLKGPTPKFFADVQKILINGKNIWIFTSKVEKDKGVLIDVFSIEGKYLDNFFLQLPQVSETNDLKEKRIIIHNNFLYTVEKDEDENPIIVKYMFEK